MAQAARSHSTPMPQVEPGDVLRATPGCEVGCTVCTVKCAVATAVRNTLVREMNRVARDLAGAEKAVRMLGPVAAQRVLH